MPPKLGQIVETILYTSSVPKLTQWYTSTLLITPFTYSPTFAAFSLPNNSILLLFDRSTTLTTKNLRGGVIRTWYRELPKVSTSHLRVKEKKI